MTVKILVGDALSTLRKLDPESVHCCATSPPYFGLRDYGTAVWEGGDEGCDHLGAPKASGRSTLKNDGRPPERVGQNDYERGATTPYRHTCAKCGATRIDRQMGLEATPELFIAGMVEVFREVRRVLRSDGVCFINMGDSYASSGMRQTGRNDTNKETPGGRGGSFRGGPRVGVSSNPHTIKPKDLMGMPWRLALALQQPHLKCSGCDNVAHKLAWGMFPNGRLICPNCELSKGWEVEEKGWWLRSDIIWAKCLSGGAIVYARTQKGEMPMTVKDMVRLDPSTVQLWDGEKWNQVHSWEETKPASNRKKKSQNYRRTGKPVLGDIEIELRSGERIGCTRDHKWPTNRGIVLASELTIGDVIDSVLLPEPPNPRAPSALDDKDIGWFIGIYLAEGSQSDGTMQIASHIKETERYTRLDQIATAFDGYCFTYQTSENGMTINVNSPVLRGIIDTYISGKTAKTKHLNVRCWQRSNAFLDAVLQGYLEGDGGKQTDSFWKLGFTNNDSLASDLRTLCARLGYSIRLRRRKAYIKTKAYPCWRGDLRFDPSTRRRPDSEIVAIRQSRARKFWNISLMEDPHTFSLASGVCTKNSNPMPESVTDRPTKAHEYIFLLTKSARYFYDADAVRERTGSEMSWKEYSGKKAAGTWPSGGISQNAFQYKPDGGQSHPSGRNRRTVWTIPSYPFSAAHFATFPPKLVEPMIKAGTSERGCCSECGAPWERVATLPTGGTTGQSWVNHDNDSARGASDTPNNPGANYATYSARRTTGWQPTCTCHGHFETIESDSDFLKPLRVYIPDEDAPDPIPCTVLDPFAGACTTGLVADRLGRDAIMIELNPEYAAMGKQRIADDAGWVTEVEVEEETAAQQMGLFEGGG